MPFIYLLTLQEYYRLTGVLYGQEQHWHHLIHDDDLPIIAGHLTDCQKEAKTSTFQYRLKRPWSSIDNSTGLTIHGETWISCLLFPETEDGECVRMAAWLTDISLQKWTEQAQSRRLEEALELKRQRENFIDVSSTIGFSLHYCQAKVLILNLDDFVSSSYCISYTNNGYRSSPW